MMSTSAETWELPAWRNPWVIDPPADELAPTVPAVGAPEMSDRVVDLTDLDFEASDSELSLGHDAPNVQVQVTFETTLGLLVAFFIGFFAPVVFAILLCLGVGMGRPGLVCAMLPLLLLTGWLALLTARMAAEASIDRFALERTPDRVSTARRPLIRIPFALAMAARMPTFSWFWRPWIAVWWISHFCVSAVLGNLAAVSLIRKLDVATVLVAVPLAIVIHFSFLFASNMYLVLASRAIVTSPRLCVRVWKYRFLIDFIVAMLLLTRGVD